VFEDSQLGWRVASAVWLLANSKNGSPAMSCTGFGCDQKSAWFMLHRIRLAMHTRTFVKMGGTEAARSRSTRLSSVGRLRISISASARREVRSGWRRLQDGAQPNYKPQTGRATLKTPVFGMIDRNTRQVRAHVIPKSSAKSSWIPSSITSNGKHHLLGRPARVPVAQDPEFRP